MMYTVGNTTATSATLSNLQCSTKYTIWVHVESGSNKTGKMSAHTMSFLPARGMYVLDNLSYSDCYCSLNSYTVPPPAPPTPTDVTAQLMNASSVSVTWQWTRSGPAPNCLNTTTVTYHSEGSRESFLQLSDPAANEATLTDLQCNNTNYTITVVATAGEHKRESVAVTLHLPLQGIYLSMNVHSCKLCGHF